MKEFTFNSATGSVIVFADTTDEALKKYNELLAKNQKDLSSKNNEPLPVEKTDKSKKS